MSSVACCTESVAACRLDTGRRWVAHELSGLLYRAGCCVPPFTLAHTGDLAVKTSGNRMCFLVMQRWSTCTLKFARCSLVDV